MGDLCLVTSILGGVGRFRFGLRLMGIHRNLYKANQVAIDQFGHVREIAVTDRLEIGRMAIRF